MVNQNRHKHYELLNLIGYGLAKFDLEFVNEFGYSSKESFYQFFVEMRVVETKSVIKNRMDLFDPFFENGRKGWWQRKDDYIHRKILIDTLFGNEDVKSYANIVKQLLKDSIGITFNHFEAKPIIKSRFKRLQETGLEAELYFMNSFHHIPIFKGGIIEDARLYGDGYDFQINVSDHYFLSEVKGIRSNKGRFRLTENEYEKACEYKSDYIVSLVMNLDSSPKIMLIDNPVKKLKFIEKRIITKEITEYHLSEDIVIK